jgi:hypothetical protein
MYTCTCMLLERTYVFLDFFVASVAVTCRVSAFDVKLAWCLTQLQCDASHWAKLLVPLPRVEAVLTAREMLLPSSYEDGSKSWRVILL